MKNRVLLLFFCCFFSKVYSKCIIFDLGGVLLTSSKTRVVKSIGITSFASYFFRHGKYPERIFEIVLDVLNQLEPASENENEPYAYLGYKRFGRLPAIHCKWLAGEISSEDIKNKALEKIDELDKENYFTVPVEKKLVTRTIRYMFNPYLMARSTRKIKSGLRLARDLAACGHTLYILSNWDSESFNLIYRDPKNKELFELFPEDHIIISAEIKDYKPHISLFNYLLDHFNLEPSECIFIDDQEENVKAAQSVGITGYRVAKKQFRNMRRQFIKQGML